MFKQILSRPVQVLALALGLFTTGAHATDAPLKIGTTAAFAIPLEAAVAEAGKQGLKVELIEFSDWIAPNVSLASGDIDVNYFQHIPFLENAKAAAGFDLVPYAPGIINNVGLYSKQYKSFDALPIGASVAIANDPINSGRGLQLLAKAGLITLKPGVGYKATEEDIITNPKKLKILQVEAVQLVRAYDDADLVQGYPSYIRLAKTFDAGSALLFDGLDHKEYVIQFVIKPENKNDPRLAKFVDIYQHSQKVRAALEQAHGKLYQPGWES
ncbi:MetQ/NlpA family ABC transporter substrate-binding protein [Pseudomonas sp. LS1212]|uniref:MetQ/NlpA family ABC transporter substrate-binding protein n=1 Tax=Pseudomonas sp. LS1212 TaxID=2972478 RepID=UPI00215BDF81|nr:MetQ/NlpA family ABC transporter substrate-binding protein [Pseudomonas sp. LS1212]UVJ43878.1 MetQ/NlpA family ABC transporter substrate-binding protein [Pseudomonas sp. LS1212]